MAGFTGSCGQTLSITHDSVSKAIHETVYSAKATASHILSDDNLILHKSFFGFLERDRKHAHHDGIHVWIDGEIYNHAELKKDREEVFSDTLLIHYNDGTLSTLLSKVDGLFVALIYDTVKKLLHIVGDRYGLKPFYLSHQNKNLLFAPEVKCFSCFTSFDLQIRKDVVDCFMQLEHFLGNATWVHGVEVAAPATIYTYSWNDNKLTSKRYWSWSLLKRLSLSLDEAAEEMATLLDKASKRRATSDGSVGVALSGGMDSRALLAATYKDKPTTYTFGIEGSADVTIAKRVAKFAGVKHTHYDLRVDHWLQRRFSGVWKTDGMLNMYHMHYSHLMNEIPQIMDINLSGFLGDAVLGGTYLDKKGKSFINKRIDETIAQHYYGAHYSFCDPADTFFDLDKVDPYLFYNRGRRMIGMGAEEANKTIWQRLPFMDTKLMDLAYSLPDEYRANSKVYTKALLLKYPEFYQQIPDATSGVPISNDPTSMNMLREKFNKVAYMIKYKLGIATSYTDVYNWIKEPITAKMIGDIIDPKHALYSNFTQHNYKDEFLIPHLQGKRNYMKQVMGALTVEIWLQQLLNKKYRNYED